MAKVIGIDLGTTNSCVAYLVNGVPEVVPNREGGRTTPSVVGFTGDGEKLVGMLAKRQAITNPVGTVHAVKRLIGRKFTAPEVAKAREVLPYRLSEAANGDVRLVVGGQEYSPQEISALVLGELRKASEEVFQDEVKEAVITVPAYFNDHQRQATKDAGRIAGLEVLRIINEPTAACLAYNLNETENKLVAVYDLGGGTFDVSILRLGDGVFEVIATAGDTYLGGEDFDHAVMDFLMAEYKRVNKSDLKDDRLALQRLKEAAEKAKCELSTVPETEINLPFIAADATGPKHLQLKLTRDQLEKLTGDLVRRTHEPCFEAMRQANVTPDKIHEVLLVGGQTRMPMVGRVVQEIFKREPRRDKNPDEVVALGAAIQAGILKGEVKEMVLLDVLPLSIGLETKGGAFTKMVDRGSAIPTHKSRTFTTIADNQDKVEIHVLQGERAVCSENLSLAKFELIGIPAAPRGTPKIEVAFEINANGILNVTAKDLATSKEQKVVVTPSGGLDEAEIARIIENAKEFEEQDRARVEIAKLKNKIDALATSIEKSFKDCANVLGKGQLESVEEALADAKKAQQSGELNECQDAIAKLVKSGRMLSDAIMFGTKAKEKA
jgi:molecular chaperone DnaK